MKIGIDARLWAETGVGRYIRNLVSELAKIDKENQYTLFLRQKEFDEVKPPGRSWEKRLADIRWHSLAEQWEMPKILKREKLNLVHFPYFNVPIFYRGSFVVTIHDLIITHFPTGRATTLPWPVYQIKRLGYKLALWWAIKNSQKIIAVSESTKKEIIDHFGVKPDKVVVTYESGELEVSRNQEDAIKDRYSREAGLRIMNHGFGKPYLLYVGNAHPHKNLERLLEAFQAIDNGQLKIDKLKLVLVGKKDFFYQRLEEKVDKMGLAEKVFFFGEANDSQLRNLYQNAKALILPSLMEGFGLPALETMGQGCLVLASDIPALHEICGDAAIYFNPLNVSEITERIKEVCFNDLNHFSKLLKQGLERAKMFSWSKMAKETLRVYKEVTSSPQV